MSINHLVVVVVDGNKRHLNSGNILERINYDKIKKKKQHLTLTLFNIKTIFSYLLSFI